MLLYFIFLITHLAVPTLAVGIYYFPAATSPAAVAYAESSGCTIVSAEPQCAPDACFAQGGRCKRMHPRGACVSHYVYPPTGEVVRSRWATEAASWQHLGPPACTGCRCSNKRLNDHYRAAHPERRKDWGEAGAGGEKDVEGPAKGGQRTDPRGTYAPHGYYE